MKRKVLALLLCVSRNNGWNERNKYGSQRDRAPAPGGLLRLLFLPVCGQRINKTTGQRNKDQTNDDKLHNAHFQPSPLPVFVPDSTKKSDHDNDNRDHRPDIQLHFDFLPRSSFLVCRYRTPSFYTPKA